MRRCKRALIAIGVAVVFGGWSYSTSKVADAADDLNVASLFSESNQSVAGDGFRGGQVSATFGSAEIDLRAAEVTGGAATIHASALFGSINLRVPADWAVDVRSSAIFGSIETKRPEPSEPKVRLTVTGSCLFGEIEVTS